MFYTPDTLTVSTGDKITGRLSCAPNARNNRDLDITIAYKVQDGPEAEIQYKMCVTCFPFPSPRSCTANGPRRIGSRDGVGVR